MTHLWEGSNRFRRNAVMFGLLGLLFFGWGRAAENASAQTSVVPSIETTLQAREFENFKREMKASEDCQFKAVQKNIDYIWVLAAAAMVFIMQAGFMCLESGLARAKNSINIAIKNMADFILAGCGFWLVGFGLMFGPSYHGLFGFIDPDTGTHQFMMNISNNAWTACFFVFQAVFCGTAATIDSGAVAERTRFSTYIILSTITSVIIYPVSGHWIWGSFLLGGEKGWLEAMGFLDFAGSTVVHSVGAWVALAGVIIVGPRIGKFDENGKPRKISPHNLVLVYLGTFILFFGWFGFNCGSTLAATPDVAGIALNTMLAACFGGVVAAGLSWMFSESKHPEAEMIANGVLAGLVGITAGCAFVETTGAAAIGAIAGVIVFIGCWAMENVFKLDDVVGAVPVHGMCGVWGTLATGIFITDAHLQSQGMTRMEQIGVQALGIGAVFVWAFSVALISIWFLKHFMSMRVTPEEEELGLNISEHGAKSSVVDLANAMQKATAVKVYDETLKVDVEFGTEIGDLCSGFNFMIDALRHEQMAVRDAMEKTSQELIRFHAFMEENVNNIGGETDAMACTLADTNSKADGLTGSVVTVAETMASLLNSVEGVTGETVEAARVAEEAVQEADQSKAIMDQLGEFASTIGSVVKTISDISFQTQLLALNASIEASRAGSAGKGFAVVAREVKVLAQKSEQATLSISAQVEQIQRTMKEAISGINQISKTIDRINGINGRIRAASEQQTDSTRMVHGLADQAKEAAVAMVHSIENVIQGGHRVSEQVAHSFERFQEIFASARQNIAAVGSGNEATGVEPARLEAPRTQG